jgi:hypothetical protein
MCCGRSTLAPAGSPSYSESPKEGVLVRASAAREAGWVLDLIVELTLEGSFGDAQIVVSVDGRVQWVYCARIRLVTVRGPQP